MLQKLKPYGNLILLLRSGAFVISFLIVSCTGDLADHKLVENQIKIYPDYSGITIPHNIAPLNFRVMDEGERYIVKVSGKASSFEVTSKNGKIIFHGSRWRKLLESSRGDSIVFDIYILKKGEYYRFPSIRNYVAEEPLDSYVVYRLIDPGFELWNRMGIYQRCVENFSEDPVMINNISGENCINCHSFCMNDSRTMMFHMRGNNAGTVVMKDGDLSKVNTKTDSTISAGVYPSWHPGGRYIAYSVNSIIQTFHSARLKTKVTDTLSDLIVYDTERNVVFTDSSISIVGSFETFPTWSPDGKYLWYCSAEARPYTEFNKIRYDLMRVSFDESTHRFGDPDTMIRASSQGKSISFPRVSPDGKYLLYTLSDFGNFSIWHKESDLYLINLETGEISIPEINSDDTESYHSWSSDGRWIVFSSRRDDGLFTRFYFSYFDTNGKAHKPFVLPQKDPDFYGTFLKSYNVPELVTSRIELNPRKIMKTTGKMVPVRARYQE